MIYEEGILGIPKQFGYKAEIINKDKLRPFNKIILLGMGGSRLAGDILNMVKPELNIHIHSDYDLPSLGSEVLKDALIIANSYSGNTIEVISGAQMATEQSLNLAIITTGGQLLAWADKNQIPHIILPKAEFPPRMMIGHDLKAVIELVGLSEQSVEDCQKIDASALKPIGVQTARQIGSAIPLIYTSERLNELGYIWKIVLNETAKMPAFHNRFPEVDHNEIAGFQGDWAAGFHSIFLQDNLDKRLEERMNLTSKLFQSHGMLVASIPLAGDSLIEQIISSIIIAHWAALELATTNNVEPMVVEEIENFKKQLQ